jgi:PAS domain S-box-containing protein
MDNPHLPSRKLEQVMPDAETQLRVLMVEDSADDAALVLRELRKSGYAPLSDRVETAQAMRAALNDQRWDIILSDYMIPGFGGIEALKIARESGLDLPFILVSGKVSEETLVEAMKAGASDFVLKGHLGRLGSVVKHELANAAVRRGARQAEIEWHAAFDAVRDAMFFHDAKFRIVRANVAYAKLAHRDMNDLIGMRYWEAFPKRDGPLPGCSDVTEARHRDTVEEVFVLPTGETYSSRSFSILDEWNNYHYSVHVLQDITERKRAQAALEQSEWRFRSMIENASDLIILINAQGVITYASPSLELLGGYTADEVLGRNIMEYTHPDDLPAAASALSAVLQDPDKLYHAEIRWRHRNGNAVALEYLAKNELDNPALRAIIINARDITLRRHAERAMHNSEMRFRAVLEQSIAGIYVIQNGKVAYVNPRMREIFGYAPDEPFNPDPLAHIAEAERAHVAEQMRRRLGSEPLDAYTVTAVRKDGSTFSLGVHAKQATFQDQPAIIAVAQDITEKERAEEEVRRYVARLEQAMKSTISVVSTIGELRDPYTHGHEHRVGELAAAIAGELALAPERVEGIRIAGYLHDIGKIAVPAEILAKPTSLNKAELALVKEHAQRSYEILKGVDFPWPVAIAARQHHERMDGSGYPQGLKDDEIILEARILAVADVVEAISSHRPYRPGLGIAAALKEIEDKRGRWFDPRVVDACLKLFRDKGYLLDAV